MPFVSMPPRSTVSSRAVLTLSFLFNDEVSPMLAPALTETLKLPSSPAHPTFPRSGRESQCDGN